VNSFPARQSSERPQRIDEVVELGMAVVGPAHHLIVSGVVGSRIFRDPVVTDFLYNRTMTIETTYSEAREQLKALMDRVVEDREVVVVRRRNGGDVALVAAEELEGLLETLEP
jgi:prevent-host-death family protein